MYIDEADLSTALVARYIFRLMIVGELATREHWCTIHGRLVGGQAAAVHREVVRRQVARGGLQETAGTLVESGSGRADAAGSLAAWPLG